MPDEQPTTNDPETQEPAAIAYEPIEAEERDEWLEEPDELPPRPRRRLLTPIPLALLGVLLIAGGFIGGVEVQKGEETSSASSSGAGASLASRFAALRGGGTTGAGAGAGTGAGRSTTGGASGGFPGAGGGGRPTTGTVAYLAGSTLYVTNAEGNTVKVNTSPATSVTKSVKTKVKGINPGETVTVTGATGSNGAVSAESISVGASAGGGGLGALFGGSGASASGSASKGSSGAGSSEPALFGKGG